MILPENHHVIEQLPTDTTHEALGRSSLVRHPVGDGLGPRLDRARFPRSPIRRAARQRRSR
jgi:hypothetical protein